MVEPQRQISYRPVRVVGALLLLQLVGLVGIGVYLFSSIDWDRLLALMDDQVQTLPGPLEKQLEQAILFAIFFGPPAVLLLVAGLSCPERDFASLPVFLPRPATRIRLPDHRLLHLDGLVPELPGCAGCVPLQEDGAGERAIGDRAWQMKQV